MWLPSFEGKYCIYLQGILPTIGRLYSAKAMLKVEMICSSETSKTIYNTTRYQQRISKSISDKGLLHSSIFCTSPTILEFHKTNVPETRPLFIIPRLKLTLSMGPVSSGSPIPGTIDNGNRYRFLNAVKYKTSTVRMKPQH
jgi:hypothetical protein